MHRYPGILIDVCSFACGVMLSTVAGFRSQACENLSFSGMMLTPLSFTFKHRMERALGILSAFQQQQCDYEESAEGTS